MSNMTASRRLSKEFALKSHKPTKKLSPTPAMKVNCLARNTSIGLEINGVMSSSLISSPFSNL